MSILDRVNRNYKQPLIPTVGRGRVDNLGDVVLTNLTANQYLKWNGSAWINASGGGGGGMDYPGAGIPISNGSAWLSSIVGLSSQFVKGDGSLDSSAYLTSVTAHNILSTTHGDTTADTVVRGDIITGQGATPKWARLAFPATPTGKVLIASATDIAWSANPLGTAAYAATGDFLAAAGTAADSSKLGGNAANTYAPLVSPAFTTPNLGTPSAGTLTSCTGLPIAGLVASTSTAIGVGSVELGHASDTTIARVSAGVVSIEGSNIMTVGSTDTVTGVKTFNQAINAENALTVSGGAITVPITYRNNKITNNAASAVTITMAVTNAVAGQLCLVSFYDYSAAAQTLTWVNTENGTITVPATSNGSTTLPITVGFRFNGATSLWRCIGSC